MAVISKWLITKPAPKPTAIMPTIWFADTLLPKMDPATAHHGVSLLAR